MIVVCGALRRDGTRSSTAVVIAERAAAAARDASAVQVVGVMPDDPGGDARLAALAAAGIGHVAVLRGLERPLDAADIDLAIHYLPGVRVVVGVDLPGPALVALAAAAAFSGAVAIVVTTAAGPSAGPGAPAGSLPEGVVVLAAPASDPDGTFAGFVASFCLRLEAGESPADAWASTVRALAVDAVRAG
jgi:hypothetical protein